MHDCEFIVLGRKRKPSEKKETKEPKKKRNAVTHLESEGDTSSEIARTFLEYSTQVMDDDDYEGKVSKADLGTQLNAQRCV